MAFDSDSPTEVPEAPRGAQVSLDAAKVNSASQPNGKEYLDEKGDMMHPEALLNRFREMSGEQTQPGTAILITEMQEVNEYLKTLTMGVTISVALLAVVAICSAGVARKVVSL